MSLSRHLMLATALAGLPAALFAQEPYRLDDIVLSAGLTPEEAEAYGRSYTTLTQDDVQKTGTATVKDMLQNVPGVSYSSGGNFPALRIRGGEANHTLILIDGVEASGGLGEYYLAGLSTANIERVEVLRGPQSVFYGSNASAGVINIITDKGAQGLHYGATVELGNGSSASAHVSHRTDRGGLSLNLSTLNDRGFDQSGDGGEKDGTTREALGLAGDLQLTDDFTVGATAAWAKERYDYDGTGFATNAAEYVVDTRDYYGKRREFQGAVWGEYSALDGRLIQRLEYQNSTYEYETHDYSTYWDSGENEKLKYRLSYGLDGLSVSQTRHLLNLLVEKESEKSETSPEYRRKKNSVAVEYRANLDSGLDIQGGIRQDDSNVFDDFTSWNIGLSWAVPDQPVRIHASAGRGLVDPTYYELFANDGFTQGNPNLKPEENRGVDLGVEWQSLDGRGTIDITYFRDKLRNAIDYEPVSETMSRVVNLPGDSRREGLEIAGQMQVTENLRLALNYTYLDAEDPDGSVAIRRPRHQLYVASTLDFLAGRADATIGIRHVSGNYDTQSWTAAPPDWVADVSELPNYTTVDLAAGYDLTEQVRVTGRVVNLFDKEYSDVWGYASQGRTAYVGLQAKW